MLDVLLPVVLSGTSLGLLGLAAGAGAGWQRARRDARQARIDAQLVRADLATREHDLREAAAYATQLFDELRRLNRAVQLSEDQRAETATGEQAAREELEGLQHRLEELQAELDSTRRTASASARRLRHLDQLVRSLGLSLGASRSPTGAGARIPTRSALRQLLVSTGAEAVALVDGRGLTAFSAGREVGVHRLAVSAALAADLEPELGAVLCDPVAGVGFSGPRFSQHLLRLHGTPWWLGVDNVGDAPSVALRHARLQLTGAPTPPAPVPPLAEAVFDVDVAPDARLTGMIEAWRARWSVHAVTALGPDGRPVASTRAADPGVAVALRRRMRGLLGRTARDRVPLDELALTAWTEGGVTVHAVPVHTDLDTALVVSVSPSALPEEALGEIRATVRWHLSATTQPDREAS